MVIDDCDETKQTNETATADGGTSEHAVYRYLPVKCSHSLYTSVNGPSGTRARHVVVLESCVGGRSIDSLVESPPPHTPCLDRLTRAGKARLFVRTCVRVYVRTHVHTYGRTDVPCPLVSVGPSKVCVGVGIQPTNRSIAHPRTIRERQRGVRACPTVHSQKCTGYGYILPVNTGKPRVPTYRRPPLPFRSFVWFHHNHQSPRNQDPTQVRTVTTHSLSTGDGQQHSLQQPSFPSRDGRVSVGDCLARSVGFAFFVLFVLHYFCQHFCQRNAGVAGWWQCT